MVYFFSVDSQSKTVYLMDDFMEYTVLTNNY